MTSVERSVSNFIAQEILHDSATGEIGLDRRLLEEGILDSLGLQRVLTFLEKEFEIAVDDDHLMPEYFETVSSISALVEELRKSKA